MNAAGPWSQRWPRWPVLAAAGWLPVGPLLTPWVAAALIVAVLAAVHHAPFGTLVLALTVTVIEVWLILSMMLSDGTAAATLARETIYAVVMITCNGVVGLRLLVGGLHHREQTWRC